jgi:3-oxoacyl-(acyl-carrier-protein) synthase
LQGRVIVKGMYRSLRRLISNSFGFGGNNCSLVFGKVL